MNLEEATHLGLAFAAKQPLNITGIKLAVENPIEYETFFFFYFCFRTLDNKLPDERIMAAGARGVTIIKKLKR
jgi:hypothetical protein